MPDSRTVYTGNDQTNGAVFRFVADTAGDLSSGELFAAKLTLRPTPPPPALPRSTPKMARNV